MFDNIYEVYGTSNPAKLMQRFNHAGNENLKKLRNNYTTKTGKKPPRVWNTVEAKKLVGVSAPTFRKLVRNFNGTLAGYVRTEKSNGHISYGFTLEAINLLRDAANTRYVRPAGSTPLIIAVANLKGGVGKTHTAVESAKKLAIEGMNVLLIDFDAQGNATLISSGLIPDLDIPYEGTITNTLIEDPGNIEDIIVKTNFDGLDVIPANLAIQDCDLILPNQEKNNANKLGSPFSRLDKALSKIKNNYDVILIDCGPNLGYLTINSIIAVNGMIIPIPPNMNDYSSFNMFSGSLKNVFNKIPDKKLIYLRILISKHSGNPEDVQMTNMIRAQFGKYVLSNVMCETTEVAKAASAFSTIYDFDKPRNSKETLQRALHHVEGFTTEIMNNFKDIWDIQASSKKEQGITV